MPLRKEKSARRYDRETWLKTAMEILAREGQAKLHTASLVKELGVTRGSFYHHFENSEDFVRALVAYWSSTLTQKINDIVQSSGFPAEQRLLFLTRLIHQQRLDRYDIAFRSWAAQDKEVADLVREVDMIRFNFVKAMFSEMGFAGDELIDRVRVWLIYQCAQHTVYLPETEDQEETIRRLHAFFTSAPLGLR